MSALWVSLQGIAASGKEFVVDDQTVWSDPIEEFSIPCRVSTPLSASLTLLPQEDGVLIRGELRGAVVVACNRCMEDACIAVQHSIKGYEPFPSLYDAPDPKADDANLDEIDSEVIRLTRDGKGVEINLAAFLWQEFSLLLPLKPLCSDSCKGLCPKCGINKNHDQCRCELDEGDPRLALLRTVKVQQR